MNDWEWWRVFGGDGVDGGGGVEGWGEEESSPIRPSFKK